LRHIQILSSPTLPPLLSTSPNRDYPTLDPDLFNLSLLTSLPLNAEAFRKIASALQAEVQQKKVLATPVRQLILRLTTTMERLHAENSILRTRLQTATNILSAHQQQKKGTRVALKNQLLLTADEAFGAVQPVAEEKKKLGKKPAQWGRKR
jgi:hypothetical protein